jgi:hypothetical protein
MVDGQIEEQSWRRYLACISQFKETNEDKNVSHSPKLREPQMSFSIIGKEGILILKKN